VEDMIILVLVLAMVLPVFAIVAVFGIKKLLFIAGPNEVMVFSGGNPSGPGYKLLRGGRRIRIPIVEKVSRIDLTNMAVDVAVTNAYSKGGIPLMVNGVANLKVTSHQPNLAHALERFLGMSREQIVSVAKDTLEGNLRGVLSQMTPEEVNEDKITFAEKLLEEAEHDLGRLGLTLDVLKIQNVADDVGYLDSIGRKSSAVLERTAKIAEADAKAEAMFQDAAARQRARLAECEAEIQIATAETARRVGDAMTKREALKAKEIGEVSAMVAKANAELLVQGARIEQVRQQLEADIIATSQAAMEAKQADAKGQAAKIVEDGKATAAVLGEMITTWKAGGDSARDIFLMEKLEKVMTALVGTIRDLHVDRITMLPGSDGRAASQVKWVEELKAGVGVDLPELLNRLGKGSGAAPAQDPESTQEFFSGE
jgi:flotillin